jgi:hypothetical protein
MPGMKISVDAAMRARDVSQPTAAELARADAAPAPALPGAGPPRAVPAGSPGPAARMTGPDRAVTGHAGGKPAAPPAADGDERPAGDSGPLPGQLRDDSRQPPGSGHRTRRRTRLRGSDQGPAGQVPGCS